MATILAIDTSTHACSVALSQGAAVQEDFQLQPQSHTQLLLPMVDKILAEHQLSLSGLDAIALTTGPGSFTGLRIGLGIVQGLAFGADLPVIPESSLRVMSHSAKRLLPEANNKVIAPSFDARMQEVYWACYRIEENSTVLQQDQVGSPAQMVTTLQEIDADILGVGDGWACVSEVGANSIATKTDFYPHAYDLALLAHPAWRAGEVYDALSIQPTYIRNEVSWKKRQKIRPS